MKFTAEPTGTGVRASPARAGSRDGDRDSDGRDKSSAKKKSAGIGGAIALIGVLGGAALVAVMLLVGGVALVFLGRDRGAGEANRPAAKPVIAEENAKPPAQKFNLEESRKSVVFIRLFAPGLPPSSGSGFFVTEDGLIATNRHVLDAENGVPPGAKIIVGVSQGEAGFDYYQAEVVYVTPPNDPTDYALLKIKGSRGAFRPLPMAPRDAIPLGEEVAALGFPFAADEPNVSFTKGVISSQKVNFENKAFYQTDAAVNPGNSGGPLLNSRGEVLGIVTLRRVNADNMGYALYLSETNLRNLPVENFVHIAPLLGPLGPETRPTLRTVAAKKQNWIVERGQVKEMKNAALLFGENDLSSFWVTNNGPLPDNFQVSFVTAIVSPDGVDKVAKMPPGFPQFGPGNIPRPGFPKSKVVRPPIIVPNLNGTLAIRFTGAATNNDILAGDGLTFLQTPQNVQVRSERQQAGQAAIATDGVFIVSILKTQGTVSYFVNGKEQMRTVLPEGAQGKWRLSVGGARGLVVLTDLYVEQYHAPVALGPAPVQAIAKGPPVQPPVKQPPVKQPPGKQPPQVDLGGVDGATKIVGGAFDPVFKDDAPAAGHLIGFEFGLGKFINNDVIRAAKPIYRKGDEETLGKQYGTDMSRTVKVVAKPGYAVGAITARAGLTVDGLSITFMKIENDRLNPNDSYESDWIGGPGGFNPVRLGGDGSPVVGVIGKTNQKGECTGLGLLLKKK